MEVTKIPSKLVRFFLEKIVVKLDPHKLKKFTDLGFIFIEKFIINLDKLYSLYFDFYKEMIENEIILADISKNDKVLHIGCGPIPVTSILIAKKTGAQITAIDTNSRSVKQALRILSVLKISDKIQISHANALNFPLEPFDLIIVSQGIRPYNETLEYIAKSIKRETQVVFRTSSSSTGKLSDNDMFLKDIFIIKNIFPQKQNALLISVLLLKK